MRKLKLLILCTMMSFVALAGCSSETAVPEKTETVKKIEKIVKDSEYKLNITLFDEKIGNVKGTAGVLGITGRFDEDNELIAIVYKAKEGDSDIKYCALGKADDCYYQYDSCSTTKGCKELEKKGKSSKQNYKDLLKKYDITTKELKEYLKYEYCKEVAKYDE